MIAQQTKLITAIQKSVFIPKIVRWKYIAPSINQHPKRAQSRYHLPPKSKKRQAINSRIPIAILPFGSIPSVVKRATDSGCAVNLKNNVCPIRSTGIILSSQDVLKFIISKVKVKNYTRKITLLILFEVLFYVNYSFLLFLLVEQLLFDTEKAVSIMFVMNIWDHTYVLEFIKHHWVQVW